MNYEICVNGKTHTCTYIKQESDTDQNKDTLNFSSFWIWICIILLGIITSQIHSLTIKC